MPTRALCRCHASVAAGGAAWSTAEGPRPGTTRTAGSAPRSRSAARRDLRDLRRLSWRSKGRWRSRRTRLGLSGSKEPGPHAPPCCLGLERPGRDPSEIAVARLLHFASLLCSAANRASADGVLGGARSKARADDPTFQRRLPDRGASPRNPHPNPTPESNRIRPEIHARIDVDPRRNRGDWSSIRGRFPSWAVCLGWGAGRGAPAAGDGAGGRRGPVHQQGAVVRGG